MSEPLKIGARPSKLAQIQVEEVLRLLGQKVTYEMTPISTAGDNDKKTPLTSGPADDFFTDALDEALLKGQIDVAVHSAKDLPQNLKSGLEVFALTESLDDKDAWVSTQPWQELAAGTKVGTSSLLRQEQIKKMRPDLHLVDIRGTIEERLKLVQEGHVHGIIAAACALKRLKMEEFIRDVLPWEGAPLQGQLAVVGRSQDKYLKEFFKNIDVRRKYGLVTLVGAGPGDPELITVKAIRALEKADCIFYDYLVDKNLLKYAPRAEHIYAGKRKGAHSLPQHELSRLLKVKAMQGKNVVRLKGGDPLIFGRGLEEIQYLKSYHISVEVIPGVTSATGIPSYLGVPLTGRGVSSSVAFVSGHEGEEDRAGIKPIRIPSADTIVFLMGLTKLPQIVAALKENGWVEQTPVLVVSRGTCIDEQAVKGTLETIENLVYKAGIKPPALIIAGLTVGFYAPRPRKTLLHCGTNPELYLNLGHIISWPMIEIRPITFDAAQREKLKEDFLRCDLVILTSPSSVEHFMKLILEIKSFQEVSKKMFAVIGKFTAGALEEFGVTPQIISSEETAQGFFKTLLSVMSLRGKRILFPRSSLPNPFLKESLETQGAIVAEWTVYLNTKPARRPLPDVAIQGVIFTSPSTAKNFLEDYETISPSWEILAKGPATFAALKEAGYNSKIIS